MKTLIMQKSDEGKLLSNFIPTDDSDTIQAVRDILVGETAVFEKKSTQNISTDKTRLAKFYLHNKSDIKLHFSIEVPSTLSQEDIIKHFEDNPVNYMGDDYPYVKFFGLNWYS